MQPNDPTNTNPNAPANDAAQPDPNYRYPQPEQAAAPVRPQVVYVARPSNPAAVPVSPEVQQRCEESRQKYPKLNISNGEYIISEAKRHPIGLIQIWGIVGLIIVALLAFIVFFVTNPGDSYNQLNKEASGSLPLITIPLLLVGAASLIGGFVGTYVYRSNTFYLTNESVIQNVQTSLFSKREQTVSLENVEDASYTQDGILPHMLNYGMIRLSTQGDETTYRFNYTANPRKQIELLNNAVEAFKNGRPVEG
ncbi:MAG: hypothetical protein JWM81_452 [Candidatus Saccharibacteria bacterium]|nr:hypothetical protein [Candidatus Saccharibacteria bacterium]